MNIVTFLYYLVSANVVADALSRKSCGSLAHIVLVEDLLSESFRI